MTDSASAQARVLRLLSDILEVPTDALRAQPRLAAHQWDSLNSLEALAQLESHFGTRLDLRAFTMSQTVGDLVALVCRTAPDASVA
jgi:acyl carrier protein